MKTFLEARRFPECAYGIDLIDGSVYYMDVDFRKDTVEVHQANVLSHPCTRKVILSHTMFLAIGSCWHDYQEYESVQSLLKK